MSFLLLPHLSRVSPCLSLSVPLVPLCPSPLRSHRADTLHSALCQLRLCQHPQVQPGPRPRRPNRAERVGAGLSPHAAAAALSEVRPPCAHVVYTRTPRPCPLSPCWAVSGIWREIRPGPSGPESADFPEEEGQGGRHSAGQRGAVRAGLWEVCLVKEKDTAGWRHSIPKASGQRAPVHIPSPEAPAWRQAGLCNAGPRRRVLPWKASDFDEGPDLALKQFGSRPKGRTAVS